MAWLDFDFGEAVSDVFDYGKEFLQDLELEDYASIATTGLAISELIKLNDQPAPLDVAANAAGSLKTGAEISSSFTDVARTELGADDERLAVNKTATRSRLRVPRTETGSGISTGLAANPLSIQI